MGLNYLGQELVSIVACSVVVLFCWFFVLNENLRLPNKKKKKEKTIVGFTEKPIVGTYYQKKEKKNYCGSSMTVVSLTLADPFIHIYLFGPQDSSSSSYPPLQLALSLD